MRKLYEEHYARNNQAKCSQRDAWAFVDGALFTFSFKRTR